MKKQWVTRICLLVLAVSAIAGVSVFAKEHNAGNTTKVTMKQGSTQTLRWSKVSKKNRKKIQWKSSDRRIVSVNTQGVVRAKKKGKATITAKYQKNLRYMSRCPVIRDCIFRELRKI